MNSLHIFLADDDSDDRDLFELALNKVDPNVNAKFFANGQLLCNYLGTDTAVKPDILFLDINMPVENGFQCLSNIRSSSKYGDICVIMYSTSRREADIKKSYDLKANGFVQKPNSILELQSLLKQIIDTDWSDPCNKLQEQNFVLKPNLPTEQK